MKQSFLIKLLTKRLKLNWLNLLRLLLSLGPKARCILTGLDNIYFLTLKVLCTVHTFLKIWMRGDAIVSQKTKPSKISQEFSPRCKNQKTKLQRKDYARWLSNVGRSTSCHAEGKGRIAHQGWWAISFLEVYGLL